MASRSDTAEALYSVLLVVSSPQSLLEALDDSHKSEHHLACLAWAAHNVMAGLVLHPGQCFKCCMSLVRSDFI